MENLMIYSETDMVIADLANQLHLTKTEVVQHAISESELSQHENCPKLTSIFNKPLSKGKAEREIGVWVELVGLFGLTCFKNFLQTLKKRMEEITDCFIERQTSGFVEGLESNI